jgi:hypothetical protein
MDASIADEMYLYWYQRCVICRESTPFSRLSHINDSCIPLCKTCDMMYESILYHRAIPYRDIVLEKKRRVNFLEMHDFMWSRVKRMKSIHNFQQAHYRLCESRLLSQNKLR